MRLRQGFVSNSSSASFIVTIKTDKDNLFEFFINNIDECYSFYSLKERLEKEIKDLRDSELALEEEKKVAIEKDNLENFFEFPWKTYREKKENILSEISKLYGTIYGEENPVKRNEAEIAYIKAASSALDLTLTPIFKTENNDCWKFKAHTTIFNDLDDVPETMRKIIVACNFYGREISCEIIED